MKINDCFTSHIPKTDWNGIAYLLILFNYIPGKRPIIWKLLDGLGFLDTQRS